MNIDSKAIGEPRIRRMAKRLAISHFEVLGRLTHVWMVCYERRDEFLEIIDAEIAAGELDGFVDAMVREGLADLVDEKSIRVRGVSERIDFLERQSEKGKASGVKRRQMSAELQKRTSVQQGFAFGSSGGSTTTRTYSPDLDQDHALDQDQEHLAPTALGSPLTGGLTDSGMDGMRNRAGALALVPEGQDTPQGRKTPHSANGGDSEPAKRQPTDPPEQALVLAHLLIAHVVANHPTGRLANSAARTKETTAVRWAHTIDKLQRIDNIPWGAIEGMIAWCQKDSFWLRNILGADNLRDKWDIMAAQRTGRAGQQSRHPNDPRPGPTELAKRDVAELERAERAKAGA